MPVAVRLAPHVPVALNLPVREAETEHREEGERRSTRLAGSEDFDQGVEPMTLHTRPLTIPTSTMWLAS